VSLVIGLFDAFTHQRSLWEHRRR